MIDQDLEKRYADCNELTDAWKQYLEFYNKAVKEDGELPPELEARFMENKGTIAMMHDSLMESLKEDRDIAQNMLAIVNRSITLKHVRRLGQADKKKIEIEWHECYLQLSETVSALNEKREKLAKVSKFQERMSKMSESAGTGTHNFFNSMAFRLIIAAVVLICLYVFVPWNDLRDQGTPGRWYQGGLDFTRDELGLIDAPYGNIDRFNRKFMGNQAPPGYTISMDNLTDEAVFNGSFQWMEIAGQNGRDYLASREQFHTRKFNVTENNQQRVINAAAYFWYSRTRAEAFEREFNLAKQSSSPHPATNQFTIARVHNVLVILNGATAESRERVRTDVFGAK